MAVRVLIVLAVMERTLVDNGVRHADDEDDEDSARLGADEEANP
jgi:hypothetical protein